MQEARENRHAWTKTKMSCMIKTQNKRTNRIIQNHNSDGHQEKNVYIFLKNATIIQKDEETTLNKQVGSST